MDSLSDAIYSFTLITKISFFSAKFNGALLVPNTSFKMSIVLVYGIILNLSRPWLYEFTVDGGIIYYLGNKGCHTLSASYGLDISPQ